MWLAGRLFSSSPTSRMDPGLLRLINTEQLLSSSPSSILSCVQPQSLFSVQSFLLSNPLFTLVICFQHGRQCPKFAECHICDLCSFRICDPVNELGICTEHNVMLSPHMDTKDSYHAYYVDDYCMQCCSDMPNCIRSRRHPNQFDATQIYGP